MKEEEDEVAERKACIFYPQRWHIQYKSNLGSVKTVLKVDERFDCRFPHIYWDSMTSFTLKINPQKSRGRWHLQKNNQWIWTMFVGLHVKMKML